MELQKDFENSAVQKFMITNRGKEKYCSLENFLRNLRNKDCDKRRTALITHITDRFLFLLPSPYLSRSLASTIRGFSGTIDPNAIDRLRFTCSVMKGVRRGWHYSNDTFSPFRWLIRSSTRLRLRQNRGSDARARVCEALVFSIVYYAVRRDPTCLNAVSM